MLSQARSQLPLIRVDNPARTGRSAASNAGAAIASGELLIFLDGDVLVHPHFVQRHLELHQGNGGCVGRGETWHLRQTRHFRDPARGTPMPGEEARVAGMSGRELLASRITAAAVVEDFAAIEARAQPAIYPGGGPRRLYDLEMQALREEPSCPTLWAAASGHNLSIPREAFRAVGGFDPALDINEHRELALRLCTRGLRMAAACARSYHLTHRRGWRDPLDDQAWMARFHAVHPFAEVALLPVLWSSISDAASIPQAARITSLPALAAAAARLPPGLTPELALETHLRLASLPEPEPA